MATEFSRLGRLCLGLVMLSTLNGCSVPFLPKEHSQRSLPPQDTSTFSGNLIIDPVRVFLVPSFVSPENAPLEVTEKLRQKCTMGELIDTGGLSAALTTTISETFPRASIRLGDGVRPTGQGEDTYLVMSSIVEFVCGNEFGDSNVWMLPLGILQVRRAFSPVSVVVHTDVVRVSTGEIVEAFLTAGEFEQEYQHNRIYPLILPFPFLLPENQFESISGASVTEAVRAAFRQAANSFAHRLDGDR